MTKTPTLSVCQSWMRYSVGVAQMIEIAFKDHEAKTPTIIIKQWWFREISYCFFPLLCSYWFIEVCPKSQTPKKSQWSAIWNLLDIEKSKAGKRHQGSHQISATLLEEGNSPCWYHIPKSPRLNPGFEFITHFTRRPTQHCIKSEINITKIWREEF